MPTLYTELIAKMSITKKKKLLLSISEKKISSRRKNHLFPASKFSSFSCVDHPIASSSLLRHFQWLLTIQSLPSGATLSALRVTSP